MLNGTGTVPCNITTPQTRLSFGFTCNSRGRVVQLVLLQNGLKGSIPERFYELRHLQLLVLQGNQGLTGTLSEAIGQLTRLGRLYLDQNGLTGRIPGTMGKLAFVTVLALSTNSLTGTIPPQLGNLNSMTTLLLYTNSLTSTIPLQLSHLTSLKYFVVSNNHLTGTIDQAALLSQLKVLMLHGNDFTGMVPSFASHHLLQHLTLFGNRLRGQLVLPTAGNMSTLYAHNNRLSCPVVANGTTVNHDKNLVVPGNVFSKPSLPWMRMGNVGFLFAETTWNRWQGTIIGLTCGSVVTLVSLTYCWLPEAQGWSCASWTEALFKVMAFQPQGDIQHLQVWAAKVLMIWSIVGLVLLWPTFVAGAHFYQCEEVNVIVRYTLCCAVCICAYECYTHHLPYRAGFRARLHTCGTARLLSGWVPSQQTFLLPCGQPQFGCWKAPPFQSRWSRQTAIAPSRGGKGCCCLRCGYQPQSR